jgi:regulatory protein
MQLVTAFLFSMSKKVTALSPQQRNKERVNVYLDDKFAFGLAAIVATRLRVGQVLSEPEIGRLKALDEIEEAYNKTLKFLTYRPRSRAELERYLKGKKVSEEARTTVMERLTQSQFVNDEDFARFWVENREQFSPRGKRALRMELRQKGISDAEVQEALGGVDEERGAYEAAHKRAERMTALDRETFQRRLGGFLQRRGYGYDIVKTVVARLWNELRADPSNSEETEV